MPSDIFGLYISTGMGEYRERFNLKLLRITINRDLIDIFQVRKINYNLRHSQKFVSTKKNSVKMGLETINYRAPQLWNLVPTEIKDAPSLSIFKENIKSWSCDNYPCRLCKTYIANVGFI